MAWLTATKLGSQSTSRIRDRGDDGDITLIGRRGGLERCRRGLLGCWNEFVKGSKEAWKRAELTGGRGAIDLLDLQSGQRIIWRRAAK
jgi:hypothetical protein